MFSLLTATYESIINKVDTRYISSYKSGHHTVNNGLKPTGDIVDMTGRTQVPVNPYKDAFDFPSSEAGTALAKSLIPDLSEFIAQGTEEQQLALATEESMLSLDPQMQQAVAASLNDVATTPKTRGSTYQQPILLISPSV